LLLLVELVVVDQLRDHTGKKAEILARFKESTTPRFFLVCVGMALLVCARKFSSREVGGPAVPAGRWI
jgi:hypothetical protein